MTTTAALNTIDQLIAEAVAAMTPEELESVDFDALTDEIVDRVLS